jgi:acetyl-CoA carboxylase biotin carboxyl carrier protein
MKPTMDDVQVVLARFDESDWDELHIDAGDFRLHVSKSPRSERAVSTPSAPAPAAAAAPAAVPASAPTVPAATAPGARGDDTGAGDQGDELAEGVVVRAPSLGTFYRSPKPGAEPYVEVGSDVTASSQLCLLEVMKLYTAVEAGVEGVIVQVLVDDAALVEHGQPLFVVRPHGE